MVDPLVKGKTKVDFQRGFTFISIVVTLAIMGLLYLGYINRFGTQEQLEEAKVVKTAGQAMACQMNRRAIERAITTWTISHPGKQPTFKDLENDGIPVLPCPDGGRFRLERGKVYCSLHPPSG